MTEIHPGSIAKSIKPYAKKIKEIRNTLTNVLHLQNINNLKAQMNTFIDISKQNYFFRISEKLESTSINPIGHIY